MDLAAEASVLGRSTFISCRKSSSFVVYNRQLRISGKISSRNLASPCRITINCVGSYGLRNLCKSRFREDEVIDGGGSLKCVLRENESDCVGDSVANWKVEFFEVLLKRGFVLAAMVFVIGCRRVFAMEGVVDVDNKVFGQSGMLLKGLWPKFLQVLCVFKEQGLVLAALLGLSAFFSMAETSITTLWPWKIWGPKDNMWLLVESELDCGDRDFLMRREQMTRVEHIVATEPIVRQAPESSNRHYDIPVTFSKQDDTLLFSSYEIPKQYSNELAKSALISRIDNRLKELEFDVSSVINKEVLETPQPGDASSACPLELVKEDILSVCPLELVNSDDDEVARIEQAFSPEKPPGSHNQFSSLNKIRELAEKEPENGVFKMLRSDVTRFLTTILIGTTYCILHSFDLDKSYCVVNIGATALVTKAATAIFGEAGVSAATGVMTVAVLLLTEITPKSIAVHNATEVARFVVRPVAWLSLILYPVGRVVTFLSMGMLKMLGLKGRSEPYVTEDELKLMLRGAELSGAIEEEEQDMIENVLEIKDTHVREVMTPLVDVVAIDVSATLIDFHDLWVTHQYSRVPVFEQRVDNIVGIAYAMDLLDDVQKGELLESSTVGDMAHKPAYFVPDSMSVWNLLREFRIRKVHMAVVLNEYGGTVGIVTLEDVVEEIVGEIFDENDSKEEIQKKTGYVVMRAEGIFDVDANTSIDQLSEDLNIKMPEGHQYETVSGFICEAFGYIPKTGESIQVVLEKAIQEEDNEYTESESDRQDQKEKHQIFKLEDATNSLKKATSHRNGSGFQSSREKVAKWDAIVRILAGNARKVSAVRFERLNHEDATLETKEVTRVVPRIMKRKLRDDEDSDRSDCDENPFQERPGDGLSDDYVFAEHEDDRDNNNKQ
ncbi:hypothetical protein HHK36_005777 [Tetracentron sinense]|uniref:Uncharacterized protein n=1 Tax=Tetracentron sinense TaxID=13715 RepID=A0A835DMN3_TETSI|nr:hypothetical protein HHK36_005777 [Tetracentron sinense]